MGPSSISQGELYIALLQYLAMQAMHGIVPVFLAREASPDFQRTSRRGRNESGGVLWHKPQENLLIRITSNPLSLPEAREKSGDWEK